MRTLKDYTQEKYGTSTALDYIERFNPNLPEDVEVPQWESNYRDLRNIASQILVTGGEISEDGEALLKRAEQ